MGWTQGLVQAFWEGHPSSEGLDGARPFLGGLQVKGSKLVCIVTQFTSCHSHQGHGQHVNSFFPLKSHCKDLAGILEPRPRCQLQVTQCRRPQLLAAYVRWVRFVQQCRNFRVGYLPR